MSELTDQLRAAGADMDGAMRRMVGDEELYGVCFAYFMNDPAFSALEEALHEKNYASAFDAVHTLKGVAGNLGLMRIYELTSVMVETLRGGEPKNGDFDQLYKALTTEWESLKKLA